MEKDNISQNTPPAAGPDNRMPEGILPGLPQTPPLPVPYVKPLDRVREPTPRKRSREREER